MEDDRVSQAKGEKRNSNLFVLACARGYLGDVTALLDKGADIRAVDKRKIGALHYAAAQGRLEVIKLLWSRGLELDQEDSGGRTPLHWAVMGAQEAVCTFLLDKGAWQEGSDAHDDTPLHLAARSGRTELVKLLLKFGAKAVFRDRNKRGLTPLGEALCCGHIGVAECLLSAGAPTDAMARGFGLLHLTAALGQADALALLLKRGLGPAGAGNEWGLTPLHCAALGAGLHSERSAQSVQIVEALLKAGAAPTARDASGKLAFEYAPSSHKALQGLLATAKAKAAAAERGKGATGGTNPASGAATHAEAPLTAPQRFQALDASQRIAQVRRWAAEADPGRLAKALEGFPPALAGGVAELRTFEQVLAIQEAINELHGDADLQRDLAEPRVLRAVEALRADRDLFPRYEADAPVMHVTAKLMRFQAIISANGHHKVPLDDLCVGTDESAWQENDRKRVKGMTTLITDLREAVARAAACDSGAEAQALIDVVLKPAGRRPEPQGVHPPGGPTPSTEAKQAAAGAAPQQGARAPQAARAAGATEGPPGRQPSDPEGGPASSTATSSSPATSSAAAAPPGRPPSHRRKAQQQQQQLESFAEIQPAVEEVDAQPPPRRGKLGAAAAAAGARVDIQSDGRAAAAVGGRGPPGEGQPLIEDLVEPFTWKGFRRALLTQLLQSLLMIAMLLVGARVFGLPLPWQAPKGAPGPQGSSEPLKPVESIYRDPGEL